MLWEGLTLALLLAVDHAAAAPAQVIYVNRAATGANDGSSWADSFTDLRSALAAAGAGDQIWIAAGTYRPTVGGNRAATFHLTRSMEIYGGFLGIETRLDQRDPFRYVTRLSGEIGQPVLDDNSHHVVVIDVPYPEAVTLDGLVITRGNAADEPRFEAGAGLFVASGQARIRRCLFRDNHAAFGAGIYSTEHASLDVADSAFAENYADIDNSSDGGAVYCYLHPQPSGPNFRFSNTKFSNNASSDQGGAIYILADNQGASFDIIGCRFSGNRSKEGGAINWDTSGSVLIQDCSLIENVAVDRGGAIYAKNAYSADVRIHLSEFRANRAESNSGGAMELRLSGKFSMDRCVLIRNTAHASDGGGVSINTGGEYRITNSLFLENVAGNEGGAFRCRANEEYWLINNTIVSNHARDGGGVHLGDSSGVRIHLVNTILWYNQDVLHGNGEFAQIGSNAVNTAGFNISNCSIQNLNIYSRMGNIASEPRFQDPYHWNFRLRPGSPCIDAGASNTLVLLNGSLLDLEGDPRIQGLTADIGVDELR